MRPPNFGIIFSRSLFFKMILMFKTYLVVMDSKIRFSAVILQQFFSLFMQNKNHMLRVITKKSILLNDAVLGWPVLCATNMVKR